MRSQNNSLWVPPWPSPLIPSHRLSSLLFFGGKTFWPGKERERNGREEVRENSPFCLFSSSSPPLSGLSPLLYFPSFLLLSFLPPTSPVLSPPSPTLFVSCSWFPFQVESWVTGTQLLFPTLIGEMIGDRIQALCPGWIHEMGVREEFLLLSWYCCIVEPVARCV